MTRGRRFALGALALASVALAAWAVWTVSLAPRPSPDAPSPNPIEGPHPAGFPGLAARPAEAGGMGVAVKEDRASSAVTVSSRVLTEDRKPIAGATVVAVPSTEEAESAVFRTDLPRATTSADGAFVLTAPDAGLVLAWADGYVARGAGVDPADRSVEIVLRAERARIVGTVRDEAGRPVAGALVVAGTWWQGIGFATTDAAGKYSVSRRGEGTVRVGAWARGFARAEGEAARGVDRVDLVLVKGVLVRGRVVDAVSGAGIEGVRVLGANTLGEFVVTGPDGTFTAAVSPDQKRLYARAEGHSDGLAEIRKAGDGTATVEIRLEPFVGYSGVVLDESGKPLAGAHVVAIGGGRATTDAEGRFRVDGPTPDEKARRPVALVARAGERTPAVAVVRGEERSGIVLHMGAPAPLVGQVVDGNGRPRPEARVTVATSGGPLWQEGVNALRAFGDPDVPSLAAPVDAEGRFRLTGLPEGTYTIYARRTRSAPWYVTARGSVAPGSLPEEVRIVVEDGVVFAGVVEDDAGRPVADAHVSMTPPGKSIEERSVETEADGRFRFEGAPDVPLQVHAYAAGFEGWNGDVDPHEGEARIRLRRHLALRWRFRLDGDVPPDGSLLRLRIGPEKGGSALSRDCPVANGEVSVEWAAIPGEYHAQAHGARRYSDSVAVTVPEGGAEVVARLRLVPALSLAGTVKGPDETPVQGAELTAWIREPRLRVEKATTNAEGRFRFDDLQPGSVRLTVRGNGFAATSLDAKAGEEHAEIRLAAALPKGGAAAPPPPPPPESTISGRVLAASGQPPRSATVLAYPGSAQQPTTSARVEEDGTFAVTGLGPGSYRLVASSTEGAATVESIAAGARGVEIRLIPFAQIRGRLLSATEIDPEATRITASLQPGSAHSARVQADGRFAFEQVTAGAYRVYARVGALVGWTANPVEVAPGQILRDVVLDLVPGGVVEGTVLGAAGKPVVGATIEADHDFAPGPPHAPTDAAGRFRIEGLAPGTWRLYVLGGGLGEVLKPVVTVEAGRTVRLELTATK